MAWFKKNHRQAARRAYVIWRRTIIGRASLEEVFNSGFAAGRKYEITVQLDNKDDGK